VDEPLNLAQCPRCRVPVYRWKVGGIEYTADLTALDGPGAVTVKMAGGRLYRITLVGGAKNIRPAYTTELAALSGADPPSAEREGHRDSVTPPTIVGGHPCKAVTRPLGASQAVAGPTAQGNPLKPSAGRQTPFSGPQTEPSGVPTADRPRTEVRTDPGNPRCDRCSRPMANGTYASIAVGDLTVWAEHVQEGACTPA
jgi:hypothetical protein